MSEIVTAEAVDVAAYAWWKGMSEKTEADEWDDWDALSAFTQFLVKEDLFPAVKAAAPHIAEAVVLELLQHVKDPADRETLERAAFGYHEEQQP